MTTQQLCIKCGKRPRYQRNGRTFGLCAVCAMEAFLKIHNPDCEICGGAGEYYNCAGQVVKCECGILDGLDLVKR